MQYYASLALSVVAVCVAAPAAALTDFERAVLQELNCEKPPSPVNVIRQMVVEGMIDPADNIGFDSMSCWRISGGVAVAGMRFVSVCAFEEDGNIRERNSDIFYRGPGSSPGQLLAFGSDVSAADLADWYLSVFGPARVSSAISEGTSTTLGDRSEVACNRWIQ
jgi:hypothetical protein